MSQGGFSVSLRKLTEVCHSVKERRTMEGGEKKQRSCLNCWFCCACADPPGWSCKSEVLQNNLDHSGQPEIEMLSPGN